MNLRPGAFLTLVSLPVWSADTSVLSAGAVEPGLRAFRAFVQRESASTGLYLDRLFAQMAILDALKPKTTRYAHGASVMEHLLKGSGNQIGFGATTEIRTYETTGLRLAGPLPADVQNYTDYQAVLKLVAAPAGRAALAAGGAE